MEVSTENKIVPKISKKNLISTIAIFSIIVVIIPAIGFYNLFLKDVQIKVDGETLQVETFASTVEEVLAEQGIKYRQEDIISPAITEEVKDQAVVKVERSFPITVVVEGKKIDLYTTGGKVEEIIKKAELELTELDKIEPAMGEEVKPGTQVRIVRVTEVMETKELAMAYNTEKKPDNNLVEGQRKVVQQGQQGVSQQVIKVTFEDGTEVNREIVEEKVVKSPVSEVVAYGTKPKVKKVSRGGQQLDYTKEFVMHATAYTYTGRNTASGRAPGRGVVAVDTRVIPFGTKLYIEGYGYAVAGDRGSAIVGNKIDVFMETESEALRWGRRNVKVYVLK